MPDTLFGKDFPIKPLMRNPTRGASIKTYKFTTLNPFCPAALINFSMLLNRQYPPSEYF